MAIPREARTQEVIQISEISEIASDISENLEERDAVLYPICHCCFPFRTGHNREVLSLQPLRYKLRVHANIPRNF
jgi:hypothetical protein